MPIIRKTRCTVTGLQAHEHGVYTVQLTAEKSLPAWRPGQFLHLAIDPYDPSGFWPDSRPFSIVNAPNKDNIVELIYAVKGWFTQRMQQHLQPGAEVWIKLPYGEFTIDHAESGVVLIAGGTGISAFTAFLEGLAPGVAQDIDLFYGLRDESVFLFREKINELRNSVPGMRVHIALEHGTSDRDWSSPVRQGLLDAGWILSTVERPFEKTYYLSGPPAMLKTMGAALSAAGIADSQIRKDAWE